MSLLNLKKFGFLAASVGLFALVAIQGCSSDDTQATPGSGGKNNTAGSAGSKGGSGPKGGSSNGGASGSEDQPSDGGSAGEDGQGGEGGEAPVDPGCLGEDDCYKCEPKTNNQFLNACVDGGCPATFDNSTLSKLNLVGTL